VTRIPSHDILKAGPNRTVIQETAPDGLRRLVIKRYRARGWLRRLGDRARARGEYEVLRALRARGIGVPEAVALRRRLGAWEVVCTAIPGARTLADLITDVEAVPGSRTTLANALGELIARAHVAGLDHADLHAGNVLVDDEGRPYLIDFTHARLRENVSPAVLRRDLTNLAADARERVPLRLRRRVFTRWWRALTDRERAALGPPGELAPALGSAAKERRRKAVRAHRASWYRGFDFLRGLDVARGRGLVRREVSGDDEAALVESITGVGETPAPVPHPLDAERELLVIDAAGEAREWWGELGRASEHALPCAEPLVLLESPRALAAFSLPAGSTRWNDRVPTDPGERLREALDDRGFGPVSLEACRVTPDGALLLGPGTFLQEKESFRRG